MYYPEELIQEIRERNDIVGVISEYVTLTRKGHNYFGVCPFHNEKTPSFSVNAEVVEEPHEALTKADVQREQIIRALRRNNGRRREAAAELFMSERTLYRKIKELGIEDD